LDRVTASVCLDVGCPDHIAPLLGFVGNELGEAGGRERERVATEVGKPRLDWSLSPIQVAHKTAHSVTAPVVTADAAPEASSITTLRQRPAKSAYKNFDEIGALEDTETIATQAEPPKSSSSKKRREKEENESQRLKRIMAICAGC
jgi:hypothetical protein